MHGFFDPRGQMGRQDFVLSSLLRGFYATIALIVLMIVDILFSINGPLTQASFLEAVKASAESTNYSAIAFTSLLSFALFTPIEIRRAFDMHLDLKWLVPGWISYFLPAPLMAQYGPTAGVLVLLGVFNTVVSLILVFKPGDTYKAFIRGE